MNGRVTNDKSVKIQKTSFGLITGAGFLGLLNSVKYRLSKPTVTSRDQIAEIISEELQWFRSQSTSIIKPRIEKTGWIFSYKTDNGGIPKLNLAMAHPDFGEKLIEIYGEQDPAVIWPIETTEVQRTALSEALREEIKSPEQTGSIDDSLRQNCLAVFGIIKVCVQELEFSSISSDFQIGAHSIEHGRAVSPISEDCNLSLHFDGSDC